MRPWPGSEEAIQLRIASQVPRVAEGGGQAALVRKAEASLTMEHPVRNQLRRRLEATQAHFRSISLGLMQHHMADLAQVLRVVEGGGPSGPGQGGESRPFHGGTYTAPAPAAFGAFPGAFPQQYHQPHAMAYGGFGPGPGVGSRPVYGASYIAPPPATFGGYSGAPPQPSAMEA